MRSSRAARAHVGAFGAAPWQAQQAQRAVAVVREVGVDAHPAGRAVVVAAGVQPRQLVPQLRRAAVDQEVGAAFQRGVAHVHRHRLRDAVAQPAELGGGQRAAAIDACAAVPTAKDDGSTGSSPLKAARCRLGSGRPAACHSCRNAVLRRRVVISQARCNGVASTQRHCPGARSLGSTNAPKLLRCSASHVVAGGGDHALDLVVLAFGQGQAQLTFAGRHAGGGAHRQRVVVQHHAVEQLLDLRGVTGSAQSTT